ncbi:glutamic acid-rich protein-like [Protopterus annectens]|uniref:glutamic acid-rich protein-like n=1 Tax=Protopterus annectens TaxID=7888 RepID=UPI001CFC2352|nr:glutamic acid-rich protein-like [Protopterus annectens]
MSVLTNLKKPHEKGKEILQSKQFEDLQHHRGVEESYTSTTKQDKSKTKIIIHLQNASTDKHDSSSLQHNAAGSTRNHSRKKTGGCDAACPSLRNIQNVNIGRNDLLAHQKNISNASYPETLKMAKQGVVKEKAVVRHKSKEHIEMVLNEPRLLLAVVKPFGLRILRCASTPAQVTRNKYSQNVKTRQKHSSLKLQVPTVPRKKCIEHIDNRLENSENQILKEWLQEKNKLLKKERRAKRKEKKANQREKKKQEKERQAKKEESDELVQEWMEKKRKLIRQRQGKTNEDPVLTPASKLPVSGLSHPVPSAHCVSQKHNKLPQKTRLQRCTHASLVVANKIIHESEQLPSATINENHSLTSSTNKLGLRATTETPQVHDINQVIAACDIKTTQPLVLDAIRSKVSYQKQVLQGDTKTDKKQSVLESSKASSKMSSAGEDIQNNIKLRAQKDKEETSSASNIVVTKIRQSTKMSSTGDVAQNERRQAVEGQHRHKLSFEQWVQKKTEEMKENKKKIKEEQADIDNELQHIVPKLARRRVEAILQNKKRVDTGISSERSENFKFLNQITDVPETPKWVERTGLTPAVVQRFMQRLQKDAIGNVYGDSVTSVPQINDDQPDGSNPICTQSPLSSKRDSNRRESEPVKTEKIAEGLSADLPERPEPQGCESQESKVEKGPAT